MQSEIEGLKTSGAEGARAKETMHINKSLSSLGDVIAARASKASHVLFFSVQTSIA